MAANPSFQQKWNGFKENFKFIEKYFLDNWKVNSPESMTFSDTIRCNNDLNHPAGTYQADIRIVVNAYAENSNTLAYASSCHQDSITGRPITGITVINMANFDNEPHNLYYQYVVLIHEVMHVLGFSSYYYNYMYDFSSGTRRKRSYSEIITSKNI